MNNRLQVNDGDNKQMSTSFHQWLLSSSLLLAH